MFKLFTDFRSELDFDVLKKYSDKPITLFNDYIPKSMDDLNINPYNFIIVHEPNEFFGIHNWVIQNHHLFTGILAWSEKILDACPNAIPFFHNARQTSDEYVRSFVDPIKEFEVSFLSGTKTMSEGHKLRNKIYDIKDQILIPKKWFYVLDDFDSTTNVRPGYGEYSKDLSYIPDFYQKNPQVYGKMVCYDKPMFHVAVENVKENNWYTEKIGEAFCTKTVPIYWGCPNIGDYYDERGIIKFNTIEELTYIVNNLTKEKYNEMKPYIDYNYEVAFHDNLSNKIDMFFKELIELNNL